MQRRDPGESVITNERCHSRRYFLCTRCIGSLRADQLAPSLKTSQPTCARLLHHHPLADRGHAIRTTGASKTCLVPPDPTMRLRPKRFSSQHLGAGTNGVADAHRYNTIPGSPGRSQYVAMTVDSSTRDASLLVSVADPRHNIGRPRSLRRPCEKTHRWRAPKTSVGAMVSCT